MTLPLPYTVGGDDDPIQGNFDAITRRFPLSRKDLKVEQPHVVGAAGEPAFQGTWVNYDITTWHGARFWKDPTGVVHLEGLIKDGTIGTTAFILPAGYRPSRGHLFAVVGNNAFARLDVAPTGNVVPAFGSNGFINLSGITFRQEQ